MMVLNTEKKQEILTEVKLLILLLFIALVIQLHLLKAPFFILIAVVFLKGITATTIVSLIAILLAISIYLILERNKAAYLAKYLCIILGINTMLSLIGYSIVQTELIYQVKEYYIQSFSTLLTLNQIANLFVITNVIIIILYGSIVYLFTKNRYYLTK